MDALVTVSDLRVVARSDDGSETRIVKDVSFSVRRGEVVALIGESGSGKTTIALSLMGYARSGCRIAGGKIRIGDTDVLSLSSDGLQDLRGRKVSYIAQSAASSFNPSKSIMDQVVESALIHKVMPRQEAERKAVELFRALALPSPETIGARYPHQVSGGQLQRLMAAMALITDPELVILDEPTTALDVTTQIEVLRAFKAVVRERRTTAIYVSHDLAVVAQIADGIVVLRNGELRETGATADILAAPKNDYTRALLAAAAPAQRPPNQQSQTGSVPLLEVRGLVAGYGKPDGNGLPVVRVLDDIAFQIPRGSTLGVIGESGSGKSTLARVIAGLLPAARGSVLLDGAPLPPSLSGRSLDHFRRIQIVFQMADTALNPSHTIERLLARPLTFYHGLKGEARQRRIRQLLDLVQLPAHFASRYPAELSGGQKQRINLARALATEPDLILCDEVTSALDTVVGAAILDLLVELRRELGVSYMFISHDLATVQSLCDDVLVLYAGRTVETGPRSALIKAPLHPYSDLLISSVPELRTGWLDGVAQTPAPATVMGARQPACAFFARCALAVPGLCDVTAPPHRRLSKGTDILCHHTEEELLALQPRRDIAMMRPREPEKAAP